MVFDINTKNETIRINDEVSNTSKEVLRELSFELDINVGAVLINFESLRNIETELGHITDNIKNTKFANSGDVMNVLYDMHYRIMILDDLLRYTVNDLEENMEILGETNHNLFNINVKGLQNQ